jgi:large subunit ribosomal protein L17e
VSAISQETCWQSAQEERTLRDLDYFYSLSTYNLEPGLCFHQRVGCWLFTVESITTSWEPRWFSSIRSKTATLHGFPNVILKTFASFVFEKPQPIGSARPGVSRWPSLSSKSRLLFKHCREIAHHHTKGVTVSKVLRFLDDVLAFKSVVPLSNTLVVAVARPKPNSSRSPNPKNVGPSRRRPSTEIWYAMPRPMPKPRVSRMPRTVLNMRSATERPPRRRRTYRAHGRIGKYASQPAPIEIILKEMSEGIEKADAPHACQD